MLRQHLLGYVRYTMHEVQCPQRGIGEQSAKDRQFPTSCEHPQYPAYTRDRSVRFKACRRVLDRHFKVRNCLLHRRTSYLPEVRIISLVLPAMKASRWGRIINISSLAALMPPASRPDYSAAKAAMIAMTASLAKDVAAHGITANTVSPGTVHSTSLDTAFRKKALERGMAIDAPWNDIEREILPLFAQVPIWKGRNPRGDCGCDCVPLEPPCRLYHRGEPPT
jgi:NAD(P)-dependent dehydrogenase (short-subunit alcohol dehydrogenase family)